jgi:hypothetical protein
VSGAEIHQRLSTQYGNSALPHRSVYEICQRLLNRYNTEGKEKFLSRIVTGDETWINHYEPESKRQSMEWTPWIANEEEIQAVHKWLHDQPKTFFVEGIRKLVDRWTKCIEKDGDYVEKLCTCSTLTFV